MGPVVISLLITIWFCEERRELVNIIAVDPGSHKVGVAVVSSTPEILYKSVSSRDACNDLISGLIHEFNVEVVVLGNGTCSKEIREFVETNFPKVHLEVVDETETSRFARERYLKENPPKGIGRLVPMGLRTPSEHYDDYVAVILAERYLRTGNLS